MISKTKRVGLITLGCDKNTVDNEYLAGLLEDRGCELVPLAAFDGEQVYDAVIVTTCGFICDAKQQSIEAIVAMAESKKAEGNPKRLYVSGCLAQRYAENLLSGIPEIDGLVGVGQFDDLIEMMFEGNGSARNGVSPTPLVNIYRHMRRRRLDDLPYAFLKIADGCNHACTFCSIPLMKGRLRSVAPEILVREAEELVASGVRELNLVAQDISAYGIDREGHDRLPDLLRLLCAVPGDFWIRCLYCYPGGVTDELLEVMANEPKILPYLDIPLQHLDPEMLRKMHRPFPGLDVQRLVYRIRERIPGVTLRTTMLVGFPGEGFGAHRRMLSGLERLRFDRLGAFVYSQEEDTPAALYSRQVGRKTQQNRYENVMELQAGIAAELNQARVGSRVRVLLEAFDEDRGCWLGRSAAEAPEVDGWVYVRASKPLSCGDMVLVEISGAETYDVEGVAIEEEAHQ